MQAGCIADGNATGDIKLLSPKIFLHPKPPNMKSGNVAVLCNGYIFPIFGEDDLSRCRSTPVNSCSPRQEWASCL